MDRLTRKGKNWFQLYDEENLEDSYYEKLYLLEDIEEEIGVDLVTKDKVEQAHMVYSKQYGKVFIAFWYRKYIIIEIDSNRAITTRLLYKDYGKTWALTEEELEEDE